MQIENITVLVIENEELQRDALLEGLKYQGFLAIPASDVKEALKAINDHRIDLIVCAASLSNEDGVLLTEQLRSRSFKNIPFIVLSDSASYEETEFWKKGVSKVLPKSLNVDSLHRTIFDTLDLKHIQLAP